MIGTGYQYRADEGDMNTVDDSAWYYVMSSFHTTIYLKDPKHVTIMGLIL